MDRNLIAFYSVLLLGLALIGCTPSGESGLFITFEEKHHVPIFNGADVRMDADRLALLERWEAMGVPGFETTDSLKYGWSYGPGNPENGLVVTIDAAPSMDSMVTLEHRVLKPDWPLWYQRQIDLRGNDWLYVESDDGAQVFQDGVLLDPVLGEYYGLQTGAEISQITIRVLNNALAGGLRDVRLVKGDAFNSYREDRELHLGMMRVLYEAFRVDSLTSNQRDVLMGMIENPSSASILQAQTLVETTFQYPYIPDAVAEHSEPSFQFTAWGDSQSGWGVFVDLVEIMANDERDVFSIGLGDLVDDGAKDEHWLAYTASIQPLLHQIPVFSIPGNHDYDGFYNDLVPALFLEHMGFKPDSRTFYSWTYKGAYFLALDPSASFPLQFDADQLEWMADEMNTAAWKEATWRFVLIHQSPYAQGWPGYHGDAFIKEWVDSLAAPKQIDFVLAGHNHDYERLALDYQGQATNFFILGGAGGGLEPPESSAYPEMDLIIKEHHFARFTVTPEQVEVSVIDLDGKEIDQVLITK